jgi:hypothetical protein
MHLPSKRLWRAITGFLLGIVFDGLALMGLGIDKSFNEASSHAQWLEVFMLPHLGIAVLMEKFPLPPTIFFSEAVQVLGIVFLFAIYPLAFTVCFALPWEKKRTLSAGVVAFIVCVILALGFVGFSNRSSF